MMTRLFFMLLLLAVSPAEACLSTFEERVTAFAKRDVDADAYLSLGEYYKDVSDEQVSPENKQKHFAGLDTDGDGRLSFQEFQDEQKRQKC